MQQSIILEFINILSLEFNNAKKDNAQSHHYWRLQVSSSPSVGKTSLIQKFAHDKYCNEYKPTIGADFVTKDIAIGGDIASMQVTQLSDMGYSRPRKVPQLRNFIL
jgi:GTPase SAR1 family protein